MSASFSQKYFFAIRASTVRSVLAVVLALAGCTTPGDVAITAKEAELYGLQKNRQHWVLKTGDGLTMVLERLEPDLVRTFYLARGFDLKAANRYAGTCVYKTVLRNSAMQGNLETDLRDWRIIVDGAARHYLIEPDWQRQWEELAVPPSARIAFKWSQVRPSQTLAPGDWLQGMSNVNLGPGSSFDLKVVWKIGNEKKQAIVEDIRCGPAEGNRDVSLEAGR